MGRLEDKIAIVTGATSGIGEAVATMYAKEGAKLVAVGRNETKGAELVNRIADNGGKSVFVKCDLRNIDDIPGIKDEAIKQFGRIDILFNSAGVLVHKPFLEQNMEDLNLIFETNFRAYVMTMQTVIPVMVEQGKGTIVNVASISSVWPELNSYFYGAMKAGITNLSRNVAKEFSRKGIRINCILPGPINTNMTPDFIKNSREAQQALIDEVGMLGRLGEPEDIAYAAVYLGSDESSFVTGIDLIVDGGVCISN
ncbi:MAG: SDR family oxidoreductase [Deltaproteobacteria bacterium]|nr:SDR family oxidoreductase [Deltaproteobacteria bacterium]